ncbi:hypothetical protein RY831_11460 [Noviherbaspirillum sp. CPCC 100848]|uniref:Uncharacterized protein n=1 Tax=Noviherbaspirillum album TaxID=3080276 RepID=A0ABU6J7Z9_9BURK|nr:hypothetical protein [Noviherbaspirillum sp. CPCC 100848]MEC4719768.1 hypothetical protein [Noviherbaspirillum sp. CPCC 100848]
MSVKSPFQQPPSSHGMHPVKDGHHVPDAAALKAAIGKGAEALGAMQLTSHAAFHELAGMVHGREAHARQARQPQPGGATQNQQRSNNVPARGAVRQRGPQPPADAKAGQGEESLLDKAASSILSRLKNGDSSDNLQQDLRDQHDPLERYRLFEKALKKLDEEEQSDEDKAPPRKQLLRLLGDLDKEHGAAIREGLEATGDMHALLRSLGEASVNAVRGWFGTARTGNTFGPPSAIDLATRLRDTFGAGEFADALSQLGQKITKNLSVRSQRVAGEPPLMALPDTRAFTTVKSCHAKAKELMRDLAELNVVLRDGQGSVDLAITLMRMAGGGREHAVELADSIIDLKSLSDRRQSHAWNSIRKALADLPPSVWPQDAGVMGAVLAEFSDKVRELDAKLPPASVPAEQKREAELREKNTERMQGTTTRPTVRSRG